MLALVVNSKYTFKTSKISIERFVKDNATCEEVNKNFGSETIKTVLDADVEETCKINCAEMAKQKFWRKLLNYANSQKDVVKAFIDVLVEKNWALSKCQSIEKS